MFSVKSARRRRWSAASAAALAAALGCAARAETLADAIAQAYRSNPGLQQQRAQLRGLDEAHVQAAAGLRPTITAQVFGRYDETRLGAADLASARNNSFNGAAASRREANTVNGQVVLSQPLYTGGRVTAAIRQADNQIAAGREALRANEGDLLLNVVDAYVSVRRDLAILDVRRTSVSQFRHQFEEAAARRDAGDATATDVAQAEAQYEAERASYASAAQQLQASRTNYVTYVGQNPGDLAPEPDLAAMPADVDQAFDRAETGNPELRQAMQTEKASRAAIVAARAAGRPTISIQGSYAYNGGFDNTSTTGGSPSPPLTSANLERTVTAEAVLTQPLYSGGTIGSGIRRALEQNNSDRLAIEATRRQVVQAISNAWNAMTTAHANVGTQERQVAAAQATYVGMKEEYRAGQRSSFDVLYAEQILRDAQIQLLAARHDAYVASAAVLRYSGALDVQTLSGDVPVYDPAANFRRVSHAGGSPFDPVLQTLDAIGSPGVGQRALSGPVATAQPHLQAATPAGAASGAKAPARLVTTLPVVPVAGTAVDGVRAPPPAPPARLRGLIRPERYSVAVKARRDAAPSDPVAAPVADALAGRAP